MIRIYCDLCGEEIPVKGEHGNETEDFSRIKSQSSIGKELFIDLGDGRGVRSMVEFKVSLTNFMRGGNICKKCIVIPLRELVKDLDETIQASCEKD